MNGLAPMALVCALASVVGSAGALVALLLPQWCQQRSAHDGFISLHVQADGTLLLWNTPVVAAQLPVLLEPLKRQHPAARIRVVLSPEVSWGQVQTRLSGIDLTKTDVDLELPAIQRP